MFKFWKGTVPRLGRLVVSPCLFFFFFSRRKQDTEKGLQGADE